MHGMKVVEVIGHVVAFLVCQILSEGLAQSTPLAALLKLSSVGLTGLPSAETSLV